MAVLPKLICRKRHKREIVKNVEEYIIRKKMRWTQEHKVITNKILKKVSFSGTQIREELNIMHNSVFEKKLVCVLDALLKQGILKHDIDSDIYTVSIKTPRYRYEL